MRRSTRRASALVAVAMLTLGVAACGDDDDDDSSAAAVDEGGGAADDEGGDGAEVTVKIDGEADDFNMSVFGYFPSKVQVRAGDTVTYESVYTGEPHTITFGTAVADAVTEFRKLTPEQLESDGPPPAELEAAFDKIPPMLPEGPGDAHQNSVNPCFVATGEIPSDTTAQCEVTEAEPFTGTEVFYNSGFLPDGETFSVTLADDIEPGVYVGFCTLHFTEMISEIEVVADDAEVPSADEVAEAGQAELDEMIEAATPAYESREEGLEPGKLLAGLGAEEAPKVLINEFTPDSLEVAAGDQVTWTINGPHTVSFNAPEEARVLISRGDDDWFHLNEQAVAPAGYEPPPPPEGEPEGPPPPVDGGTWDGTGFLSSGIAFGGDFLLTISEPGTYEYVCLIHPEMEGTVTVS